MKALNGNILVIDPIPFTGGSKKATSCMLKLLGSSCKYTIFTMDPTSWQGLDARFHSLWLPGWLMSQDRGLLYFLKFLLIAIQVLLKWPAVRHNQLFLCASGPGIDLASYLVRAVCHRPLMQLIHGPVAASRTIGRCLDSADAVHYLPGCKASIHAALARVEHCSTHMDEPKYMEMINGLAEQDWPANANLNSTPPKLFWAASLLKWKGLDLLLDAIRGSDRLLADICYIKPKDIDLPQSQLPANSGRVTLHHQPDNLDEIRAGCQIFVSTSHHEPFGLSILEAIAAGQCVVIPADGSYWDKELTDGTNCIKYQAGNSEDLSIRLESLYDNPHQVREIGLCAMFISRNYHAETVYLPQVNAIKAMLVKAQSPLHHHHKVGLQ